MIRRRGSRRVANFRGPASLGDVARDTGATAVTVGEAIEDANAVLLAVPYTAIEVMPRSLFERWSGNAVIDVGNYFPMRDGAIAALDGPMTDTEWVSQHFGRPVAKASNSISVRSLRTKAAVPGIPSMEDAVLFANFERSRDAVIGQISASQPATRYREPIAAA